MEISPLAKHVDALTTIADWYIREWGPFYGPKGPGDALSDLRSRCNENTIPIGLVAREGEELVGVVALDIDVATNLTPSVVGLLVPVKHRSKGIAAKLLEAAAQQAKELGFRQVYISSSAIGDHLVRNGWCRVGEAEFLNDDTGSVYVRELSTIE